MNKNTVIWDEYPPEMEIAIPAKWIMVAENLLNEYQYKDWLFYTMKYFGCAGIAETGDTELDIVLNAVYDDDDEFFDQYYNSILKKKLPIEDLLKVSNIWTKEDQLNGIYRKRN